MKTAARNIAFCLLAGSSLLSAQNGGWRRVGDPPPPADSAGPNSTAPSQMTMQAGTFVSVRIDQPLSSDRNQAGDAFSATLEQPIIVDGVVVARQGQTVGGRVAEARKAGRGERNSRLGVQLTDLTLVDGQVVPVQSTLASWSGGRSVGRDVGTIAGTTGLGAAIGAAAGLGTGAAIGAGAGVVAGTIGVLLTPGRPTVIYPESVLTFRLEEPVTISTDRASQAFRYAGPNDYDRPASLQARRPPLPPRYYYGYGYPYPYYPYYYGPGWGFYYGPTFYFRGGFRRGFRR